MLVLAIAGHTWQVTCGRSHVAGHMWQVTCGRSHVAGHTWLRSMYARLELITI
jgi:hypothetical protein